MNAPIRLFIVDDHSLFREGLIRLLEREPSMQVVGSAGSAAQALEQLEAIAVDVLIADYDLGTSTAVPLLSALKERGASLRSLMVTAGISNADALKLIRLGVSGIVHKNRAPEELQRSILDVAQGKTALDQEFIQTLLETAAVTREKVRLTERERRILSLLLEGFSNKQLSTELLVSESAVKAALQQLFAKTGVRTRSQLVRIAIEDQL